MVVATADSAALYGPGHRVDLEAEQTFVYLPIDCVEWVLHRDEEPATTPPTPEHRPPAAAPIPLAMHAVESAGLYPEWAAPWLGLPFDVGTWASELDVRSTSLSQRTKRLCGESPKRILSALRTTVAFALADHYRGHGTELALDAGFSSQAHLSNDVSKRFGVSLSHLMSDEVSPELDWLRLLRGALR